MTGNTEAVKPTPLKLNFIYNPQRAVLTNNVVNFIRHHAGAFYPAAGLDALTGFRRLMQVISNTEGCLAPTTDSYEFAHVTDGNTNRFTLNERFKYEGLSLAVVPADSDKRTEIAAAQSTPEGRSKLLSTKTLGVYLDDELRGDGELWENTKACTGIAAADFFAHFKDFLDGPGKKLNVYEYHLTKSSKAGVVMNITLLIPRVTAYYLRVQVRFS